MEFSRQVLSETARMLQRLYWQSEHHQVRQVQKVQETWKVKTSTQTVKRVLKSLRMSWHRFRRRVGGQPDQQEYWDKQAQLVMLQQLEAQGELDLYYLDEARFCLIPCIPYGWQPIGTTVEIDSKRSRRLNVLDLMTRSNHLKAYVSEQSITSHVVIACIDAFSPPLASEKSLSFRLQFTPVMQYTTN